MAIKVLKNQTKLKLSTHIDAYDFRCKCGKSHNIEIDTALVDLLEKLFTKLEAKTITIYSGYRCSNHDKKVGGSGKGTHVEGKAVDCYFTDKNGQRISSKTVCLTLEDMGHKYGIGYRCGGGSDKSGQTHIDVKSRKWYGDESKSTSKSCCSSFYDYFGIKKEVLPKQETSDKGTYEVISPRMIRTGPHTTYRIKKVSEISADGRKHVVNTKSTADAQYKKGTRFNVLEIAYAPNGAKWGRGYSGWICLTSSKGTIYCKKVK